MCFRPSKFVHDEIKKNSLVVLTVVSGILFALFPTVECVAMVKAFYVMTSLLFRKVPVEKESSLSIGGAIIFLALFPQKLQNARCYSRDY